MAPIDDITASLNDLKQSSFVTGGNNSYKGKNPNEYKKVMDYLNGGAEPDFSTFTYMGKGLCLEERARRGLIVVPPPPPPPPTWSAPIVITDANYQAGGIYTGSWESTDPNIPCIDIQTAKPVTIRGAVRKLALGDVLPMIRANSGPWGNGCNVTIDHVSAYGPMSTNFPGGVASTYGLVRFIQTEQFNSLTVSNCTIDKTGGIDIRSPLLGATCLVTKNDCRNIQSWWTPGSYIARQFVQFNSCVFSPGKALVNWNQVINEFGKSRIEDTISCFGPTQYVLIENNYLQGGYPWTYAESYSGTGIILNDTANAGGHNIAQLNQIVGQTNLAAAIVGGIDDHLLNNRCISSGRAPDGTILARANNGIVIYLDSNPPSYTFPAGSNHTAVGNIVGAMTDHGGAGPFERNDWWCPGASNNVDADNTAWAPAGVPTTLAQEAAEFPIWQAKLATNGIIIGSG